MLRKDMSRKLKAITSRPINVRISDPVLSASVPQNAERIAITIGEIIIRSPELDGNRNVFAAIQINENRR